jgi:hypothetical protein
MNEIADNDNAIGILFKTGVKEFELRRAPVSTPRSI